MGFVEGIINLQTIGFGLILTTCWYFFIKKNHQKLNEPLLVPYSIPLIGHTFEFYNNSEAFIKKCREQYGETFSLYVFGSVITIISQELSHEVFKNHKDFSFTEASNDTFPLEEFLGHSDVTFVDKIAKIVRENLAGDMGLSLYTNRIQDALRESIEKSIGECKESKCVRDPVHAFLKIISQPIASTIIGEELAKDEELVNTFAYLTNDLTPILSMPQYLSFIYPKLHTKVLTWRSQLKDSALKKHQEIMIKKITPVVEQRLRDKKNLGDSWVPPKDIMQLIIDEYRNDIRSIVDCLVLIIFAAVHTTSQTTIFTLFEFGARPEYWKELLEENKMIFDDANGRYFTVADIARMEKLDSFIKETLRCTTHLVGLPHKTLNDSFTFSNGCQVPKGRNVYLPLQEIHNSDPSASSLDKFDGFRYLQKNNPSTKTNRFYLAFGHGKHACPGRFFAIHEIKIILLFLMKKYRIETESKKVAKPVFMGPMAIPSHEGLVFKSRD